MLLQFQALSPAVKQDGEGTKSIEVFLADKPEALAKVKKQLKASLKDAAAVNTIRKIIAGKLRSYGLLCSFGTGGQTKFNRTNQGYRKDHWIDAVCVGNTGSYVFISKSLKPLQIKATGRGSRQMCKVNKYGFPRTTAKKSKTVYGFATGDLVKAIVTKGKKIGTYSGKVAVRSSGYFNIQTGSKIIQGISWKYCKMLQRANGYRFN